MRSRTYPFTVGKSRALTCVMSRLAHQRSRGFKVSRYFLIVGSFRPRFSQSVMNAGTASEIELFLVTTGSASMLWTIWFARCQLRVSSDFRTRRPSSAPSTQMGQLHLAQVRPLSIWGHAGRCRRHSLSMPQSKPLARIRHTRKHSL